MGGNATLQPLVWVGTIPGLGLSAGREWMYHIMAGALGMSAYKDNTYFMTK